MTGAKQREPMSEEPDQTQEPAAGEGDALESLIEKLKQQRDELQLKMHLASKEAQDQWAQLEETWQGVQERAEPLSSATREAASAAGEQAKKVTGAALDVAAREIAAGYEKLRKFFD